MLVVVLVEPLAEALVSLGWAGGLPFLLSGFRLWSVWSVWSHQMYLNVPSCPNVSSVFGFLILDLPEAVPLRIIWIRLFRMSKRWTLYILREVREPCTWILRKCQKMTTFC